MTSIDLVKELAGTTCRCGAEKEAHKTLCRGCYYRLPKGLRNALYRLLGEGYEEAYEAAARFLDEDLRRIKS